MFATPNLYPDISFTIDLCLLFCSHPTHFLYHFPIHFKNDTFFCMLEYKKKKIVKQ